MINKFTETEIDIKSLLLYKYMIDYWAKVDYYPKACLEYESLPQNPKYNSW